MPTVEAKSTKRKLLDESESESEDGGAPVNLKVNEEYAKRFEHNKNREERHRLEEKLKNQKDNDDDDSSSDETEDEDGFLATEDLDAQISATLQALRSKDPRVYDSKVHFYKPDEEVGDDAAAAKPKEKKEKPVYLQDYHREKLLKGDIGASDDEDEDAPPQTYVQQQDALRKSVVKEMHAAGQDDSDDDNDDFLVKRKKIDVEKAPRMSAVEARAAKKKKPTVDVETADQNPETFLSNFMAARAWVPEDGSRWAAFESDDGEDTNDKADEWEQAYNLRFEDPEKSNEVLKTYARDVAAARSVRRDDKTGRSRRRELEKEKKEEERKQRKEDKARLRKLKIDEAEEKIKKLKQAAGAVGKQITDDEWLEFLDGAWDNDKWEEEMNKRFGEDYYAVQDEDALESGDEDGEGGKKTRLKKPKWDDDIDIKDIVPDFDDGVEQPKIALSDDETKQTADGEGEQEEDEEEEEEAPSSKKRKTDHKRAKLDSQKKVRQERAKLEALVDSKLELSHHDLLNKASSSSGSGGFKYRETEPLTFGMTARDILLAPSDAALNDYAGIKKLAHWRDQEKKAKDAQRLSKKKRLQKWRRDVFGKDFEKTGPTYGFEKFVSESDTGGVPLGQEETKEEGNIIGEVGEGKKKRKRSRKNKSAA